ncbi:MAG: SusC/RagA family TonB-linked outer membrane protein [Bacteroidetes bacterium]|nr:SusC/RagA family TonB-linked outer membrane protein [Bacteroidota bacterium]
MMNSFPSVGRVLLARQFAVLGKIAMTVLFTVVFLGVQAQERQVTGKVKDGTGTGMPGVTVAVKGTQRGTSTDVDGNYKVAVPTNATLVFSYVGYSNQEIAVGTRSVVDVTLLEDNKVLNEVVVVGYGTVKKKDATGAVNAIGAKDFQKGIVVSPEQLMQGRVAGVQITQSSGEPGGGINVRIRGTSSVFGGNNPLFVIDGVPLAGDNTSSGGDASGVGRQPAKNPLNFLNPEDIASIDILKDASATAIYGSRGANGVVLITTKKGKGKGTLEYGYSLGASSLTKRYDLLSADEYRAAGGQDQKGNTDWQNELFRTGYTNQHNFAYGAGDNNGSYRFTLGYLNQQGIIKESEIKRYSLGFNGSKKFLNDRLTIASNINISNNQDANVPISENVGFEGDLLGNILKANPTRPVYNSDGTFNQPGNTEPNPLAMIVLSQDNTNTLRALGNINAELQIVKNLKFKTVIGFDKSFSSRKSAYSRDLVLTGVDKIGRAYVADVETDNKLWENYFTYDKEFNKITFNALLGYSYQMFSRYSKNIAAANFRTNDLDLMINNIASANAGKFGSNVINNSGSETDELQSYFGRVNVGINDKYLLTATLRSDGSTKFGGNNKYGFFPSFAAKWKIMNESFAPKNIFDDLAVRLGYGLTGNQSIPHNVYDRRDRYSGWGINQGGDNIEGGGLNAVAFNNPNLKWETTSSINLGLDFAILKNRLSGTIDFYQKNTKDLLFYVISAQPAPTPFTWKNLDTDIQNRGLEISLTGSVVDKTNFGWEVLLNAGFNKNMVNNLNGVFDTGEINGQGLTGAFAQRIAAGQPLFAYFLRDFGGYDENGNSLYPNGDYQQFLNGKSPLPTATGGLTNNLRYKNWDLSLFFNGVFGNYLYSNTENAFFTKGSFANGRNVTKNVVTSKEGPLNAPDVSTRFLQKGDFVRLQNLNLSYRVPVSGKTISNLRVFLTGQNLMTFTKYTGQDPEVSTNKSINGIPSFGIDYTAYPRARTWTIGANISF